MYDLVIKNGTIITAAATLAADIGIRGEKIAAVGHALTGKQTLDAAGKLVTPGAVDIHVHMQMPLGGGVVSADNFYSGTRAAAFGGTTTIIDFVQPDPEQSMLAALTQRRAAADPQVTIDYGLHMTIGPSEISKLSEVADAYAAGCTSFKLYMAYGLRLTDDQLFRGLEAVHSVRGLPVVHAENWDIITTLVARNLSAGRVTPHWHPRSRPALMEAEAAGRVIDIATLVGTPVHIFHVSCAPVARRIAAARQQGLPVTGETCPQYLFLTQDVYDAPGIDGMLAVCSPPLRTAGDQEALWAALARDELQIVTTDHCPFIKRDKARGADNFSLIPGGVPSIEMRFAALYSHGVRTGRLTANQWVAACCTTPAILSGLKHKGDLAPGFDADIVIFDPDQVHTLTPESLHEQVDWTPYDGLRLHGWPAIVLRRGEVIVMDDTFQATPGSGRFINRAD